MKKKRDRIKVILAATILLALICCDKNDLEGLTVSNKEVLPELQLSLKELSYEAGDFKTEVSEKNIELSCNTNWEFINVPEWLDVKPSSGKGKETISIKPTRWDKLVCRNWILRLKADRLRDSIMISQDAFTPQIALKPILIKAKSAEDTILSVKIESNTLWHVSHMKGNWFEALSTDGEGDDTIMIKRSYPSLWSEEDGVLECFLTKYDSIADYHKTIELSQKPMYYLDVPDNQRIITLKRGGGYAPFDIDSNVEWRITLAGDVSNWKSIIVGNTEITDFSKDIFGNNNTRIKVVVKELKNLENKESWLSIRCDDESYTQEKEPIIVKIKQIP